MKYVKLFEQFKSHQEIDKICAKYSIENYTINDDGSIDVNDVVNLSSEYLKELPLIFRNVTGDFYCDHNELISLKGSPIEVGGDFNCSNNNLISLDFAPINLGGDFSCRDNKLTSLVGSPNDIKGFFSCSNNVLITLDGAPSNITRGFDCSYNYLISLEGVPGKIGGKFNCSYNSLYSFEYFPDFVGGDLYLPDNLEYIFSLFNNKELIYAFNDYNIIKAPKNIDDKPRLKLSNLNSFLSDNGFEELKDTSGLEKHYDLK